MSGDHNQYQKSKSYLDDFECPRCGHCCHIDQEPVAWISDSPTLGNGRQLHWTKAEAWRWSSNITPLYTSPPKRDLTCVCGAVWEGETMVHAPRKREWFDCTDAQLIDEVRRRGFVIRDAQIEQSEQAQPLTDEEIETIANDFEEGYVFLYRSFARAIESAHGIGDAA